ncbi:MAG: glycosyl transferase, group 1 [Phenylobacterium sp.]|nr:glycosyl transferase, group 1 [Phenylobacterium sp.]
MRILYLVHQFMPDFSSGTEQVTLNLARAAQSAGHRVDVFTVSAPHSPGWTERDGLRFGVVEGVPVFALAHQDDPAVELGFGANTRLEAEFRRFLESRPAYDVAHVMHAFRLNEAVELLAARHVPYVMTLTDFYSLCFRINLVRLDGGLCDGPRHGEACARHCATPDLEPAAYAERAARTGRLLRRASAVTTVSEYVAWVVRAEHPDLDVRVIPNGVDLLSLGAPAPGPASHTASGKLTFGYLGTVSEAKGAVMLAEAFAAARPTNARLRIVGPCHEPQSRGRIEALLGRADMTLEGPAAAADVGQVLGGFDVLCLPSLVPETFSLALHEGFAVGLPALVADRGAPPLVVAAHGCGRVVTAGDVAAWARAIGDIAADPQQLATWAARVPLPQRIEEEGFLYTELYRAAAAPAD